MVRSTVAPVLDCPRDVAIPKSGGAHSFEGLVSGPSQVRLGSTAVGRVTVSVRPEGRSNISPQSSHSTTVSA